MPMACPVTPSDVGGGEENHQPGRVLGHAETLAGAQPLGQRRAVVAPRLDVRLERRDRGGHGGGRDRDDRVDGDAARAHSMDQVRTMPTIAALAAE